MLKHAQIIMQSMLIVNFAAACTSNDFKRDPVATKPEKKTQESSLPATPEKESSKPEKIEKIEIPQKEEKKEEIVYQPPVLIPQQPVIVPPTPTPPPSTPNRNTDPVVVIPQVERPTPTLPPPPPAQPILLPNTEVKTMNVRAIPFINMEHGMHASDAGNYAILEDTNQNTLAVAKLSPAAATRGKSIGMAGAYSASNLKMEIVKMNSNIPSSGQALITICPLSKPLEQLSAPSSKDCIATKNNSSERPVSWRQVKAPFTYDGKEIQLTNQVYGQGSSVTGGLTLNHIVYSGVQGAQVATNDDGSSPLVIDLNKNNKIDLLAISSKKKISFDIHAEGKKIRTAWINKQDALLALDVNQNGKIDDGSELFGESSHSVKPIGKMELSPFVDGFEALAQYDLNKDSKIDSKDIIFKDLILWQDLNSDGVSQKKELFSLSDKQIVSIDLKAKRLDKDGIWPKEQGSELRLASEITWKDLSKSPVIDVWFEVEE